MTGNVDFEQAVRLSEKWLGCLPNHGRTIRNLPVEPKSNAPKRACVHRDVPQDMIIKAYHTCGRNKAGFPVCDIISDILANGSSARFFKNVLMKSDVFTDLDAAVWGSIDPGLLVIKGKLSSGASIDDAERLIKNEVDSLAKGNVSRYEIEKYVNKLESKECFENISYADKASKLCYYQLIYGDANEVNNEISKYRQITTEQVASEASRLFDVANETTIFYGPSFQ